jgi:cysteinyl-tRNA synthetase
MLKLTNSLSKKKEEFKPISSGKVGIYNCGPTVYDYIHIGNLRAFVTADLIRRVFEYNNYDVTQVMNITDVGIGGDNDEGEDKIIKGLKREGKPITLEAMKELTEFYTEKFLEDLAKLNILKPGVLPKASEHIAEDIELITELEKKDFVYKTSDGMYFDTSKDRGYGKLGGLSKEQSETSARIAHNSEKKNYRDFAVWKFNSKIGYESPWGQGFPGWHIECSAMSRKYLGPHFDIHTGGIDLAAIHHNNEIAQSESACDCTFVNYWLHNAFVNVEAGKMAKSEGTGIQLQTIIDKNIDPLAYRYFLLSAHYRTPITFSWEGLEGAKNAYTKLIARLSEIPEIGSVSDFYKQKFTEAIDDDLNTPQALALVFELLADTAVSDPDKKATILDFDTVLGLNLAAEIILDIPNNVQKLIEKREQARKNKQWKESDELRFEIEKHGFSIKDTENGPKISRK